jgi:hypothetical protein
VVRQQSTESQRSDKQAILRNKLSVNIEENNSLSISMEEEINTKNMTEEEMIAWKDQTKQLFVDEKSIKGAMQECGTFLSEDLLTYSLTNTLKTVESLEDKLSIFDKKSKVSEEKKNKTSEQEVNYKHHSFESSQKFSSLAESQNGSF